MNFEFTSPHPRRFAYKSCPHHLGNARCCRLLKGVCGHMVESEPGDEVCRHMLEELGGEVCGHMVEAVYAYNFEVVVVDAVYGPATPIRA